MEKTRYYYDLVDIDQNQEIDMLTGNLTGMIDYIKREPVFQTYKSDDVGHIDAIAYDKYGNEKLWWVIALVNGIIDPFGTTNVNNVLLIPSKIDIYDFYKDNFNAEAVD